MLSKKLAIAAASAALMLGAFAPMAFADVNVDLTNHGFVDVSTNTQANSGLNGVVTEDGEAEHVDVTSGAATAGTTVSSVVNNNLVTVTGSGNGEDGSASVDVNNCGVVNVEDVNTQANSGLNGVVTEDGEAENASVTSGAATAGTGVSSLVNVNSVTVTNSGNGELVD